MADLEPIEETLSNPYFSYTLGFNIKHNEIRQCKLYIRFFDRDDSSVNPVTDFSLGTTSEHGGVR